MKFTDKHQALVKAALASAYGDKSLVPVKEVQAPDDPGLVFVDRNYRCDGCRDAITPWRVVLQSGHEIACCSEPCKDQVLALALEYSDQGVNQ